MTRSCSGTLGDELRPGECHPEYQPESALEANGTSGEGRAPSTLENSRGPVTFALVRQPSDSEKRETIGRIDSGFTFFLNPESKTVTFLDLFLEVKE
jgi:hypothetical protein